MIMQIVRFEPVDKTCDHKEAFVKSTRSIVLAGVGVVILFFAGPPIEAQGAQASKKPPFFADTFESTSAHPVLGSLSFPTSARLPEAQEAFADGMLQLHLFEYSYARGDFRRAEKLEPGFAMAYWGEAMTYNAPLWGLQDRDDALAALGRLAPTPEARLAKAPTAREKGYLAAVEILYGQGTKAERDAAYSVAMERLAREYPKDDEAQLFYALSLLGLHNGVRDVPTYMRAAAIAERIFCRNPKHPGAAHYLIHSVDDPVHAVLGLDAARALAQIAPDAGHAQHMTSHIFLALGMWDDVVSANERAIAVVNRQRAAIGRPPERCGHYPYWLEYGDIEQGRFAEARRVLTGCRQDALGSQAPRPGQAPFDPDSSSFGSLVAMWSRYVIDTRDWNGEIARWSLPVEGVLPSEATYAFTAGFAAAQAGRLEDARRQMERFEAASGKMEKEVHDRTEADPQDALYLDRLHVLRFELEAAIDEASGKREEALAAARQAVREAAGMPYAFGPPFVNKLPNELLGEMLLARKEPTEAEKAFEEQLARARNRTASILGLARSLRAEGKTAQAAAEYQRLAGIWHAADESPDVAEARAGK
jgi:hypothetical protein